MKFHNGPHREKTIRSLIPGTTAGILNGIRRLGFEWRGSYRRSRTGGAQQRGRKIKTEIGRRRSLSSYLAALSGVERDKKGVWSQ